MKYLKKCSKEIRSDLVLAVNVYFSLNRTLAKYYRNLANMINVIINKNV